MPLAMSQEHGHNLQTVQMLLKKNQVRDSSADKDACLCFLCFFKTPIRIFFFFLAPNEGRDVMKTASKDEDSIESRSGNLIAPPISEMPFFFFFRFEIFLAESVVKRVCETRLQGGGAPSK